MTVQAESQPLTADQHATRFGLLLQEQNKLQQQTRNAVRFIAWVTGVFVALSLIGGIWGLAQLSSAVNTYNQPADISNCLSVGGTDPSC